MKSTEQEMRAQVDLLRRKLEVIDAGRRRETNRALVGKCFKYRNSYGPGPTWWLYARVTKAGDYWPQALAFQQTTRGFEVTVEKGFSPNIGYTEISRAEYNRALAKFKGKLLKAIK